MVVVGACCSYKGCGKDYSNAAAPLVKHFDSRCDLLFHELPLDFSLSCTSTLNIFIPSPHSLSLSFYSSAYFLLSFSPHHSQVMQRATAEPSAAVVKARAISQAGVGGGRSGGGGGGAIPVQERVHKCVKVWTLYLDLEESLGTVDSARAAYHKLMDLKIATPQLVRRKRMGSERKREKLNE